MSRKVVAKAIVDRCQEANQETLDDAGLGEANDEEATLDEKESAVEFALLLNLERRPRLKRDGETEIELHDRKQASERESDGWF